MNNPFNKLKVHRDDEDVEQPVQQKTVTPNTNTALAGKDDKKPKKKVRPEEKKEEQVKEVKEEVNDEGFEVVGKQKKQKYQDETEQYEEKPGKKDAPKNFHQKRNEQNLSG